MKNKILVNYSDLIVQHGTEYLKQYLTCKMCGGHSGTGKQNRGIIHRGDCVVDRWELKQTIADAKRGNFGGYAGGYRHTPANPLAIWEAMKKRMKWSEYAVDATAPFAGYREIHG